MLRSKNICRGFIIGVLTIIFAFPVFGQESQYENGMLNGVIRIKLKPDVVSLKSVSISTNRAGIALSGIHNIDVLNKEYSVSNMTRVFPYSPKFEERHIKHGLNLWYEIRYNSQSATPNDLIKAYSELPEVETSEPILEPALVDGGGKPRYVKLSESSTTSEDSPFNDPLLKKQWHYDNTGQTGGTPGEDINLFNAWQITHGSSDVIVAVMDQGVDYTHEDLKNMMWVNQEELDGETGIDDDDNGFIDDIYGVNFATNTGALDIDYHGTHVAGTVAAENNNGIGVCGVAGGSGNGDGVRIMSCQILGGDVTADIALAYVYAADMGAVISQNSWGWTTQGYYEQAVRDAIDYFIEEAGNYTGSPMKGGVVIFAAGNDDTEELMYPGAYGPVITVAALNSRAFRSGYSNYGTWIDIAAPGGDYDDDAILDVPDGYSNMILSTLTSNSYGFLDGTSMACPHVSGIAALVVSKYGGDDFTNSMLESHLLTGVRYIEDIEGNADYIGKLGVGYADAYLALGNDNHIAPDKITDFTLTGIAQDFATFSWTVPADDDDDQPGSFEIYYSTQTITDATLDYAKKITIDNRKSAGETQTYELDNLLSVTNYYFAVVGVDRWGNQSVLSNIINARTNSGPVAYLDSSKTELNIVIDVTQNSIGKDSVKLLNKGEGVLKWDAITRNVSAEPLSRNTVVYPPLNALAVHENIEGYDVPRIYNNIQQDTSLSKTYVNTGYSLKVFGETNLDLPNSSATRFYVDDTAGFNLTHVTAWLEVDTTLGAIIVEIYKGYDINNAELLLSQEYKPTSTIGYLQTQLDEQIYFNNGEYFWVVYHIPPGNKYPLGGGLELDTDDSENCYMSLDWGKTWTIFEELYIDSRIVWAVWAQSLSQNIDDYLVLSPESGTVSSDSSVYVSAAVDASELINGSYKSNLVVSTNETGNSTLRMPVNLTVKGHKPVIKSEKRSYFGSVLLGNKKDIEVVLNNTGYGRFTFTDEVCSVSNSQFTYIDGASTNFDAKTSQSLTFRFTPTQAGNNIATVTLLDQKGQKYSFELFGSGVEPPVAEINPETFTRKGLALGDIIQESIYLKNTGKFPLDYYLPNFADGSNMEETPVDIQKYAYSAKVDNAGDTYQWNDISATGTDITEALRGNRNTNIYHQIQLDFLFPFYGENQQSVYITKYGALTFTNNNAIQATTPLQYKNQYMPDKYISGAGFPILTASAGYGNIYYKQFSDKLIVQYEHCPYWDGLGYNPETGTTFDANITFQIILNDNGDIDMYYKEVNLGTESKWTLFAIEDKTIDDGLLIYGRKDKETTIYGDFEFGNTSAIHITSPGLGLFSDVSNPYGTVMPGDSVKIDYTVKTDSLYLLSYLEKLVVVTNDPVNNPVIHNLDFSITSGGEPDIIPDTTSLDFGTVYRQSEKQIEIALSNKGYAPDTIKSASFDNNYFTIKGDLPVHVKPERRIPYIISINTENVAVLNDTLRILTASGKEIVIALKGEVVQGPVISLQTSSGSELKSIVKILQAGQSSTYNFKVSNTGPLDLHVAPVGNGWATVSPKDTTILSTDYSYSYKTSLQSGGPVYEWIELAGTDGTRIEGTDVIENQWSEAIKLPFKFNFYGNLYDTLYIGASGLVTFTPDQDSYNYYYGSWNIPTAGEPDNFIAPLFVFGGPSYTGFYPLAGQWYRIEDDQIIIEFRDYNTNFSMGLPISAEVILYKNGNIKFQYLMPEDGYNEVTNYSAIGIENIDGTKGLEVSYNDQVIDDDMSVLISPVKTYVVEPDVTEEFVIDFSAKELVEGSYTDSLIFYSDDPLALEGKVFMKLIVMGEAQIEKPDSIYFGDVMVDPSVGTITKEFEIKNTGSANFVLNSASQILPSYFVTEIYGGSSTGWASVTSGVLPKTIEAHKSLKFRVSLTPTTPMVLEDTLLLNTTLATAVQKIPISAHVYNPAKAEVNGDTISYYAETPDFTAEHDLKLTNAGGYTLTYTSSIGYVRNLETEAASANNSQSAETLNREYSSMPMVADYATSHETMINEDNDFNRVLAYGDDTTSVNSLGYGGSAVFESATAFYAPSDGFNLTHVQTWYTYGSVLDTKVEVRILTGDEDVNNCTEIYSEVFDYNADAVADSGRMVTFDLSQNIPFYPNEKFFVVFSYPSTVLYPQGCVSYDNTTAGYFYFGSGSGWYDLSDYDDFLEIGWMVRAAEETVSSKAWVYLDAVDPSSLEPSVSKNLKLYFDASKANKGDNYAVLTIESNDIEEPSQEIVLYLRNNQGPVFSSDYEFTVSEGDTLNFTIQATDAEGNDFDFSLNSDNPLIKIVNVDEETLVGSNGFTPSRKTAVMQYTPDYFSQGDNVFSITTTDAFGNSENTGVLVHVTNVNRAPEAVSLDTLVIKISDGYLAINTQDIFTDADDDIVSISAVAEDKTVVQLFNSDNDYLVRPLAVGKTNITFVATDAYGETATNVLPVKVTDIDNAAGNVTDLGILNAYPNPTSGSIRVYTGEIMAGKFTVMITNSVGTVIKVAEISSNASFFDLDMKPYASGFYFVKVFSGESVKTAKIIKE